MILIFAAISLFLGLAYIFYGVGEFILFLSNTNTVEEISYLPFFLGAFFWGLFYYTNSLI